VLILIDTSVWVDLLGKAKKYRLSEDELGDVVTCPPIIQEVLQGIKDERARDLVRDRFLALTRVGDPVVIDLYLMGADIYLTGRQKGLTIRSSIDCLIAAIALKDRLTIWHNDRDFENIAKFTALKTITRSKLASS